MGMRVWDVTGLKVDGGQPQVLHSTPQGRAIAIHLPAGSELGEHEVHEGAWLVVASGRVRLTAPDGAEQTAGPGALAAFEPGERHAVGALEDARLLLLLTPWPAPDRRMAGTG
jgi:quercetin dioxygenase-like cupin family protein